MKVNASKNMAAVTIRGVSWSPNTRNVVSFAVWIELRTQVAQC